MRTKINDKVIIETFFESLLSLFKISGNDEFKTNNFASTYLAQTANRMASEFTGFSKEESKDILKPLHSIFSRLNGEKKDLIVPENILTEDNGIAFPKVDPDARISREAYHRLVQMLKGEIEEKISEEEYNLQSWLNLFEERLSYIPVSYREEFNDLSFYDHLKYTALFSTILLKKMEGDEAYLDKEYNDILSDKSMLLFSADFSGIQDFIYTIVQKNALRTLRSRSFYLETLMENFIDELLEATGLNRSCLIYAGGGHCYILLPNTEKVRDTIDEWLLNFNNWLIEQYGTRLYLAAGYADCSMLDLMDLPVGSGSYRNLFKEVSSLIAQNKQKRYNVDQIRKLNSLSEEGGRECKICGKTAHLVSSEYGGDICRECRTFERISRYIQNRGTFAVTDSKSIRKHHQDEGFRVPGIDHDHFVWIIEDHGNAEIQSDETLKRVYTKDHYSPNFPGSIRIMLSDYASSNIMDDFAASVSGGDDTAQGDGIRRFAVVRMDVDNLGNAFVRGFEKKSGENRDEFVNIVRTGSFSRSLSTFFKKDIDEILSGNYKGSAPLNLAVVYAGGDDLFLVGNWNDIITASLRIVEAFREYTDGSLSVSGGIGIFNMHYPIRLAALETEVLESTSKSLKDQHGEKNAIALFTNQPNNVYHWDQFSFNVYEEKVNVLQEFFKETDSRGNNMLYNIMEFLRDIDYEQINIARLAYLLSRLEPGQKDPHYELYKIFSRNVLKWARDPEERRELITAIEIHVYRNRKAK